MAPVEYLTYDLFLAGHLLSVLVGYGSITITGIYATKTHKRLDEPEKIELDSVKRYFKPGTNWPERMIFMIPIFGVPLLSLDGAKNNLLDPWVLATTLMWIATLYLSITRIWPSEKIVQSILAQDECTKNRLQLESHLARLSFTAIWIVGMALSSVLVMFVKPSW